MLESFALREWFCGTCVRVYVELTPYGAEVRVTITHDRRLVHVSDLRGPECADWTEVDDARKWLKRDMGERGNFVEWAHWMASSGLFKQAA